MSRARTLADLGGSADAGGLTGTPPHHQWCVSNLATRNQRNNCSAAMTFLRLTVSRVGQTAAAHFTVEQSTDVPNNEFEFSAKLTNTAVQMALLRLAIFMLTPLI